MLTKSNYGFPWFSAILFPLNCLNLLFTSIKSNLGLVKDEYFKPIWIKAILGFALIVFGLVSTFLVFRFIPIPKEEGFDGLGGLMIVLFCLGGFELSYILGVIFSRNHPYVIFTVNLFAFILLLFAVRFLVIG
jgi:hypothetical protein